MASELPDYIASAKPIPQDKRAPWYKNTAPTYAGIMLWFVFWQDAASGGGNTPDGICTLPGGALAQGLGTAFLGLVIAALICHFLFYLVPGLLGMKSGLPLYIVGTSTYGAQGGFLMPGFLMGVLQFGWLGVNAFFSSMLIWSAFGEMPGQFPHAGHAVIAVIWAALAAFMGLKGIQYVARVATFLPLIPLVILIILFAKTFGTVGDFDPAKVVEQVKANNATLVAAASAKGETLKLPMEALGFFGILALLSSYVVGFFATAGAAGCDFGMNNPDAKNVQIGGFTGIALATIIAGGASMMIAAGAIGSGASPTVLRSASTDMMGHVMGNPNVAKTMLILMAIASFPPACFSSFIAANSFKTTLPKVNPFVSVGIGTLVSIILAVSGWAGRSAAVFEIIGASFGPICGAMMVDYLLAGRKWPGPRAGFNPAGWISWAVGFVVGILPRFGTPVPAAPVLAFLVGAVLYLVLAKIGLQSKSLPMPQQAGGGGR